jgi:hypothetical protein
LGRRFEQSVPSGKVERKLNDLCANRFIAVEEQEIEWLGRNLSFHRKIAIPLDGFRQKSDDLLFRGQAIEASGI